jgi:hypothetical protein
MAEHKGGTDAAHTIKLESSIQRAAWTVPSAAVGATAAFEVVTLFVGDGAAIELTFKSKGGKKLGEVDGTVAAGRFEGEFEIPDKADDGASFEVELPKHKLKAKSNLLRVKPAVTIENVQWDRKEARRGDVLELTADIKGLRDGESVPITIYEHDDDGAHDLITKLSGTVRDKQVKARWEYEYHDDTDDIPTAEESEKGYNPPEYFFRVDAYGVTADSGLLTFQDWVAISLTLGDEPAAGEDYVLKLPDGSERRGTLDDQGKAREKDVPPGEFKVEFPRFPKKGEPAPAQST